MSTVESITNLEGIFEIIKQRKPDMIPIYTKQGKAFNAHYFGNYNAIGDTSIPGMILKDGDSTLGAPELRNGTACG